MTDFPTFWKTWRSVTGRTDGKAISRSLYTGITNGGMWVRTKLGDKLFLDASHDELEAAVKAKVGGISNEPKYRPHCETWLRQGRFEDEPEHIRREVGSDGRVPTPAEAKQWLAEHPSQTECNFVPNDWGAKIRVVE